MSLPSVRAAMRRLAREADRVPEDHDYCPVGAVHKADLRECANAERMLGEYNKALRKMVNTHGAHGPCEGNDCRDCGRAYDAANTLLASQHGSSAHSDLESTFLGPNEQAAGAGMREALQPLVDDLKLAATRVYESAAADHAIAEAARRHRRLCTRALSIGENDPGLDQLDDDILAAKHELRRLVDASIKEP